jgi:hypothetical protein
MKGKTWSVRNRSPAAIGPLASNAVVLRLNLSCKGCWSGLGGPRCGKRLDGTDAITFRKVEKWTTALENWHTEPAGLSKRGRLVTLTTLKLSLRCLEAMRDDLDVQKVNFDVLSIMTIWFSARFTDVCHVSS